MATSDTKMTTDMELAKEIEWSVKDAEQYGYRNIVVNNIQAREIIAALRRGPERPPSGEMVMVPREPTDEIVWAICDHSDAPVDRERCLHCPAKEPTHYGEGTRGCRALAEDQYRAMLAAAEAEAEGRKS